MLGFCILLDCICSQRVYNCHRLFSLSASAIEVVDNKTYLWVEHHPVNLTDKFAFISAKWMTRWIQTASQRHWNYCIELRTSVQGLQLSLTGVYSISQASSLLGWLVLLELLSLKYKATLLRKTILQEIITSIYKVLCSYQNSFLTHNVFVLTATPRVIWGQFLSFSFHF